MGLCSLVSSWVTISLGCGARDSGPGLKLPSGVLPGGRCYSVRAHKGGSAAVLTKRIPSLHNPLILSHSILKELLQVQQSLGYCPQFDALFDELTAQEHLELYTRLRGIPWKDEERVGLWASTWQH